MSKDNGGVFQPAWLSDVLLSQKSHISLDVSQNIIHLVDDGASIPFIARYRKDKTNNMDVDQLKRVVATYEDIRELSSRIQTVCKSLAKAERLSGDLQRTLCHCTSLDSVETLNSLHKPAPKGSLAERAKVLGLEQAALDILNGKHINLNRFINRQEKGLQTLGEVEKGMGHIIADIVAKNQRCFEKLRELCHTSNGFVIKSSKTKSASEPTKGSNSSISKTGKKGNNSKHSADPRKFEQYFDFTTSAKSPPPHVVLALNRGEDLKVLLVKVVVPKEVKSRLLYFANGIFLQNGLFNSPMGQLVRIAMDDAYDRLMEPTLCRQTRSNLTRFAEKQSIAVFASNLKCVLLSPPTRSQTVIGVDPGFRNGCKVAVVSDLGNVLDTEVIYFHCHTTNNTNNLYRERSKFASLITRHRCGIIAIGNGVACRETELIVSEMISSKAFGDLDLVYCIVDECGASIYSISDEAKHDLPTLDPTLRGAVSIARRLIDPLAEFVKIDPQHLGVGMYQHDVSKTKLQTALQSVVEECVSFVGVDLNTCSECLLRRVSGLSAAKAKKILEFRTKIGRFTNRHQLLSIKGLGDKAFQQCAGFVRVLSERHRHNSVDTNSELNIKTSEESSTSSKPPGKKRKLESKGTTSKSKKAKLDETVECNALDMTAIHPESYDLTQQFIDFIGVSMEDLGTDQFIQTIRRKATSNNLQEFKDKHQAPFSTVQFISNALMRPITFDLRDGSQKPLFKTGVRSMSDLQRGETLTGRVNNVTHFGAFVDVGVGQSGLIHGRHIWTSGRPKTGDKVSVKVDNVDLSRNRIGLILLEVMEPTLPAGSGSTHGGFL